MKKLFIYTLALFVFWLGVFFLLRLFFVLYQLPIGNKIKKDSDLYEAFIQGYQLDFSTSTILLLLPLLAAIAFYIFNKNVLKRLSSHLVLAVLIVYISVALADAGLYREWSAKINMQALDHFKNPVEVIRTLSFKFIGLYLLLLSIFTILSFIVYKNWIFPLLQIPMDLFFNKRLYIGISYLILSGGLAVVVIRGGITNMPINQSIAYFSNDILANDIAVNPLYNLIQDLDIKGKIPDSSVYKFRSNQEAKSFIAKDFENERDTILKIFKTQRPNLVFMFLESWSNDNIGVLGGLKDCTPQFDHLSREGLLFTNAYANAYVSDQGIPAVLSAYPSASRMAITNQPAKVHNLPCISEDLLPLGYSSSFLFGGELVYGNLRGYLLEKNFTDLVEVYNMPQYPKGSLGIQDEHTLQELLIRLGRKKPPFLYGYFSQSTHMPYDFTPSDSYQSDKNDPEKLYTESVHYADFHLGRFFAEARKQVWYDSTIFIVIADHSHNTHAQWELSSAMHHKIPLLMLGGALRDEWKGKRWDHIVSQLDVVGGVLTQMGLDKSRYTWSRNLFNPYLSNSAYFVFYGGVGYVTEKGYASYSQSNRNYIYSNLNDTSLQRNYYNKATSFQQLVYEDVRTRK